MSRKRMLYRYEWNNLKWFLAAGVICSLVILLGIYSECATSGVVWSSASRSSDELQLLYLYGNGVGSFGNILIQVLQVITLPAIVFLGVMAAYQFSDYHKKNKREFIVSLPYTQRERLVAKLLTGFAGITGICLVFGIGIAGLRMYYFPRILRSYLIYPEYKLIMANDTWFHTIRTLLLFWLILLTAYAVYIVVHSLVAHGVTASLVGVGIMLTPLWVKVQLCAYEELLYDDSEGRLLRWLGHHPAITRLCDLFSGQGYYRNYFMTNGYYDEEATSEFMLIDYSSSTKVIVVVILLLLVCVLAAWLVNARQDGAKLGQIVPEKPVRILLSAGMAVCFGLGVTWIFIFTLPLADAVLIGFILLTVCLGLYWLANWILKRAVR